MPSINGMEFAFKFIKTEDITMGEHDYLYSDDLIALLEEVCLKHGIKHIYYVGLPPKSVFRLDSQMRWQQLCDRLGIDYTIVEIFKPWAEELSKEGFNVVCADILKFEPTKSNSLLLWSHGPEHVPKDVFINTLPTLVKRYTEVFIAMPYGVWKQSSKINPYEYHHWSALPDDLRKFGFSVVRVNGEKDNFGDLYAVYKGFNSNYSEG